MSETISEGTLDLLAVDLLRQGRKLKIRLSGASMFPCLVSSDMAVVIPAGEKITRGDIVAFASGEKVILHRVRKITNKNVICKGDSNCFYDEPVETENIAGKLHHIERKGKIMMVNKHPWFMFWKFVTAFCPCIPPLLKKCYLYLHNVYGRKTV